MKSMDLRNLCMRIAYNIERALLTKRLKLTGNFNCNKHQVNTFSSFNNERKLNVDGVNINYIQVGNGPNPILCLPSTMGSIWSDFKPQIEHFDRNKFTIVVWDPPGYGNSRPPSRDFSAGFLQRDADYAAKLMKALSIKSYSLLGWSGGGITALMLASKYKNEVEKLVVWGASAYLTPDDIKIYQGIRDISKWSEGMRAPLLAIYGEEYFRKTWESWVDAFVDIFERNKGDLCRSLLADIECPTLIIHGDKDPVVPKEHPEFLLDNIKNSEFLTFEKGKHNLHIHFYKEFNKVVEKFIYL